ncbi:hypothetical protein JVX98_10420 [Ensifer sp. PDNC004]|uniref:phage tail tip lysozyme n=1 Tax=Ensifer sp. PDNC004 TaxID=2811423 RepID=UPI001962ED6E|nr:phage tail tip lysozyme [Ensifer sp. PDNC004]QRY68659.1 hypothetical protein JVX98_10420 [Ensifer sp. PDNC004]
MTKQDKPLNSMGLPVRIQSVREAMGYFDENPILTGNKTFAEVEAPRGEKARFKHPPPSELMSGDFRKAPIPYRGTLTDTTRFHNNDRVLPADRLKPTGARDKLSDNIAERLKRDLQQRFKLSEYQAAAIVGNLDHESGGFRYHQEVGVGDRGGAGWAQWTGDRRDAFKKYSEDLDPKSYEANYGYLEKELTDENWGEFMNALYQTDDLESATKLVSDKFLAPNKDKAHADRRQYAAANAMKLPDHENDVPHDHRPWKTPIPRARP